MPELKKGALCLGEGSFSRVMNGFLDNSPVAIKVFNRASYNEERVRKEIEIHRALKHPKIVELLLVFKKTDNSQPELVMEWLTRGDLATFIDNHPTFKWADVEQMLSDIISGLSYLHSLNILHRDIKPANMLLTDKMTIKIADFGLATYIDDAETDRLLGTPEYLAPELLQLEVNKGVSKVRFTYTLATESYAFGILVQEMVSRKVPFNGFKESLETEASRQKFYRYVLKGHSNEIPSTTPDWIKLIIKQCSSQIPEKRPLMPQLMDTLTEKPIISSPYTAMRFFPRSSSEPGVPPSEPSQSNLCCAPSCCIS